MKFEVMITSLIEMLESPNFADMWVLNFAIRNYILQVFNFMIW